ncbi:hypothetical protein [Hyphomicrobium sp. LHD-15]|uniref:hypothetical protein n=1 Tax=Hyphomicrobium sp. LHD-15 TaxID=3072142 RepID=UPI00280FE505|nr:hypothetical protein [Hyphomicrobium sp. LHD-15]MDQ8699274.1 hypothetical protein [Hyphomicrobium sp. LHD-15]
MTPDAQPHGNFVAFLVRDKEPGDKKPTFDGRLRLPTVEGELTFALWGHEYADPKTGEVQIMFNGRTDAVSPSDAPMVQVAALLKNDGAAGPVSVGNLQIQSRQLVLFPNRFKAEDPAKQRPDYWGAYNPGNGQPMVRISAWLRKDRYQNAMMAGATSYPLPGKSEVEQQEVTPTIDELEAKGQVSRGMPEKTKKRSGGRGE